MSNQTSHRLDTDALRVAIYARMLADRLGTRQAAAQVGISAYRFTRIKQGQRPDADALVSLLVWLGRCSEDFTVLNAGGRDA